MGVVRPIKKPDPVRLEPVMIEVARARALAWTLAELGAPGGQQPHPNNLVFAFSGAPEETHAWVHMGIAEALTASLDEIEREYRKLPRPAVDGGA
jgi:hypothetical protein